MATPSPPPELGDAGDSVADHTVRTVGRLAADLGHDLNNQLSVIINYSFVLQRALAQVPGAGAHMDELTRAAWRASDLVESIRSVAGARVKGAQSIDLEACLFGMQPLLQLICEGSCELSLRCGAAPRVHAPLAQLERIVCAATASLAKRARQYTPSHAILSMQGGVSPNQRPQLRLWLERTSGVRERRDTPGGGRPLAPNRGIGGHAPLRRAFQLTGARATRRGDSLCITF